MDDYDDSALDDHQNSLNRDLESLKRHLDSLVSSYKKVSNYNRIRDQNYANLKKCVEDYNYALKLLLADYGDLLTLSLDPEESEDYFKQRIQDKLDKLKNHMADRGINLQYQIPGEQYVDTDDILSLDYADTTDKNLNGVVKKIACIGLNSENIKGDREIRESTVVYRYRDSSDSSISDTSAKEGASKATALALLGSPVEDPRVSDGRASCAVRKDGGDDIDATHGTPVYSEVSLSKEGISEETSHEADSTNQTDENGHALADVDARLHLIDMDRNPDGKYELPLNESFHVGISNCTIAILKVSVATDLKITLTDNDTSLSLELAPIELAPGGISLAAYDKKISYGTYTLEKQNTGSSGTNVTYKKITKPIEYYAHVTNTENAEDVKLELEEDWEFPGHFVLFVDSKWFYYRPSMDKWSTEPTESVVKSIANYTIEDFDRYVRDLYKTYGSKKRVIEKIREQMLTSGVLTQSIKDKVDSILPKRKKS